MTRFKETLWADSQFLNDYQNDADIYLPFRNYVYTITKLFYKQFLSLNQKVRILDLGCGDGVFVHKLLSAYEPCEVIMIDGSQEMLDAARHCLGKYTNINYIKSSFQELLVNNPLNNKFELIFSSLAIHHLSMEEKVLLFNFIHDHLSPGGHFLHYDVVLPPTEKIEKWYLSLWRHWIEENSDKDNLERLVKIPEQYKSNSDNIPDTLKAQMDSMEKIGFKDVDCYFKYGIFSLFGGCKG